MNLWAQRILPAIAAATLVLLLQPWHLRWWMIDVGVGIVLFMFSYFRDPARPELTHAWIGFAASGATWLLGFLVARSNGLALEELVHDQSLHKTLRRIPDYAVVFATFAVLLATWSFFPRSSEMKNGA